MFKYFCVCKGFWVGIMYMQCFVSSEKNVGASASWSCWGVFRIVLFFGPPSQSSNIPKTFKTKIHPTTYNTLKQLQTTLETVNFPKNLKASPV